LFDLSEGVAEKPNDFSLFVASIQTRCIRHRTAAAGESRQSVKAVLVTLGEGHMGLAEAQELRDELADISKAGKPTFVYADDTTRPPTRSPVVPATSACSAAARFMIPGVRVLHDVLQRRLRQDRRPGGLRSDRRLQRGQGAVHQTPPPAEELRGELNRLTDHLYGQIVEGISVHRKLSWMM